ncbi:MAG: UDP-3-O-(3-hydroxymyristoyl)glucosamine N-acyltransferase, partial [Zetaproteobacteria bacterium]|nr:UDP-3-O-(3-hydroxymyristoyl)glucosamine N-acyltransferase [Flavobacteriales bacterium]
MKFTATQISEILHGEIEGNPDVEVFKLSKIEESEEGSLTFLSNLKYTPYLYNTKATIAIVNKTFVLEKEINTTLIKVEDSYQAFSKLLAFYNNVKLDKKGIEEQSFIDKSAHLGQNLYLGSHSYIGANVKIGNNVKIFPNVFIGDNSHIGDSSILFSGVNIYSDTIIGTHCIIHSGVVIGSDGFGFAPSENGVYTSIPQIGNVII